MSTGFGLNGGRNRCFPFWTDFVRCNANGDDIKTCAIMFEDYQECLYHRKEHLRQKIIQREYLKQTIARKNAPAAPAVEETQKDPAA